MIKFLTKNFWLKMASIAVGCAIWFSIVVYEDPYMTKTFYNVPVEKKNEYLITNQKKEINYVEGNTIDIRVKAKKSVIDKLSSTDVTAFADLQYISVTGAVDIDVKSDEGVTVVERIPDKLIVELENIVTVQREVQYLFEGTPADGYVVSEPFMTPNYLNITGAESKINQIRKVIVPINVEGATRDITMYVKPQILDYRNMEIPNLKTNVSEVKVTAAVDYSKNVLITFVPNDTLSPDLSLEKVTLSPDYIKVSGATEVLKNLNEIKINDLDLSAVTGDSELATNLDKYLPKGATLTDDNHTLAIKLDVEPIISRELEIPTSMIKLTSLPKDLSVNFDSEQVVLKMSGKETYINSLSNTDFDLSADLAGITKAGTAEIEVKVIGPVGAVLEADTLVLQATVKQSAENPTTTTDETVQ